MNKTKTIAVQLTEDGVPASCSPSSPTPRRTRLLLPLRRGGRQRPFFTMMIDTGVDGEHGSTIALNIPRMRWCAGTPSKPSRKVRSGSSSGSAVLCPAVGHSLSHKCDNRGISFFFLKWRHKGGLNHFS